MSSVLSAIQLVPKDVTREDFTIPIDYDDAAAGSVGDPPAGVILDSQRAVDTVLAEQGWTAFKHVKLAYEALPTNVLHTVTFELAKGVHRPDPSVTYYAWEMETKQLSPDAVIKFVGADPSDWDEFDVGLSDLPLTAAQNGSYDPWVQVAGTPFAGKDLRGMFAVLDTGQVGVIQEHDDNTLHLLRQLSPVPVLPPDPTPTQVTVARPSTEFRNSDDDSTAVASLSCITVNTNNRAVGNFLGNMIQFENVLIDLMGAYTGIGCFGGSLLCTQCMVDRENSLSGSQNGDGFYRDGLPAFRFGLISCSVIATASSNAADSSFRVADTGICGIQGSYFRGGQDGATINNTRGSITNSIFDSIADYSGWKHESANIRIVGMGEGVECEIWEPDGESHPTEIRGAKSGAAGIFIARGGSFRVGYNSSADFIDNSGPCIKVGDRGVLNQSSGGFNGSPQTPGFHDGGGNLDVGVELAGRWSRIALHAQDDISGANGDMRVGNTILSYSDFEGGGDIDVAGYNVIRKEV